MEHSNDNNARDRVPGIWLVLVCVFVISACQTVPSTLPEDLKVRVLVSGESASEKPIIRALKSQFGQRMKTHRVGKYRKTNRRLVRALSKDKNIPVVTVGNRATMLAAGIKSKPVYVSQAYDPKLIKKMGAQFRGVSIVPDARSVFWILRSLDKTTKIIGIITRPGMKQTIDYIKKSAKADNLKIIHREARSDRGFLYSVDRISSQVDAYWLFPDDRILSSVAIKTFMMKTVKQGKQVIAFTPALLKLGALVSVEPDESAIAGMVNRMIILDHYRANKENTNLQYVKKMRIRISKLNAERLGISIPVNLQRFQYE